MNLEQIDTHVRDGGWLTNRYAAKLLDEIERLQIQLAAAEEAMRGYKAMAELQAAGGSPQCESEWP